MSRGVEGDEEGTLTKGKRKGVEDHWRGIESDEDPNERQARSFIRET